MRALVLMSLGWLALLAGILLVRAREQRRRDAEREVVRLHFPAELDFNDVVAFLRTLSMLSPRPGTCSARPSVVFETVAAASGIEHRLRLPRAGARGLLAQLRAALPAVVVEPLEEPDALAPTAAVELGLSSRWRALRTDQPESAIAAQLAALQPLAEGERVVAQWVVSPTSITLPRAPRQPAHRNGAASAPNMLRRHQAEVASAVEVRDKLREPVLSAVGRLAAEAATPDRADRLVARLRAVLRVVERPGLRFRLRLGLPALARRRTIAAATPIVSAPAHLNARELAIVISWPLGAVSVPGLERVSSRLLVADPSIPTSGRVLGDSPVPGAARSLAISAADGLRHLHVVGPTGVGKTTLLAGLAVQDVTAGRGVVLIDPKGDLAAQVLDRIPRERAAEVIVLDPTDDERPIGLNLLEDAHRAPELVADLVVGLFHRLFASSWGPRTADVLHASLLTLAAVPGMTLVELPLLLTGEAFRRCLVGRLHDPVALEPFWAWYEALSPGERAAVIGPVMNKLRAFLLRRRLRLVLGQAEPAWRLENVLNRGQILIVPLGKGELGHEAAALVGSLVVARLWQAIQRRAIRLPVGVYIDEFQDVLNLPTDLADVLAQARSFGVGLTLAHQHLGQLDPRLKGAVLANARSRIVFQAGAEDAAVLARTLGGGLTASDLMRLPVHQAYAAVMAAGSVTQPFSLRSRALPDAVGSAASVRAASRERYGQDRTEVEAAIIRRHGGGAGAASGELGRRRRAA